MVGLDEKVTEVLDQVRCVKILFLTLTYLIAAFRWLASSRSLPRLDEDSEALLRTPDDV